MEIVDVVPIGGFGESPVGPSRADRLAELEARVAALEAQVARLVNALGDLVDEEEGDAHGQA